MYVCGGSELAQNTPRHQILSIPWRGTVVGGESSDWAKADSRQKVLLREWLLRREGKGEI